MFTDIKQQMDTPDVREMLKLCVFDDSDTGITNKILSYQNHDSWKFYGWFDNNKLEAICGFEKHSDYVEILHIAVAENAQKRGVGKHVVNSLREIFALRIEAETDDDAVGFYQRCGFVTVPTKKYNVRRWECTLQD